MFLLKNKYNRKCDIRYLKLAYILANNLGLVPCFDFDNNVECNKKRYKLIAMFNCIIVLIAYVQFLFKGIDEFMKKMTETELTVDNLEYLLITLFNLYTILGSFTYHNKSWIILLKTFNDIDESLTRKLYLMDNDNNDGSWFPLEFIAFNVVILSTFIFEIIIWFHYSMKPYIYYLCPRLQLYYIFVTALMICLFGRSLLNRYRSFNEMLLIEHDKLKNCNFAHINKIIELKLDKMLIEYRYLNRLIKSFNNVFGWVILIFNGVVIMACLECFNLLVLSLYVIISFHYYQLTSIPVMMFTALLMVSCKFVLCKNVFLKIILPCPLIASLIFYHC